MRLFRTSALVFIAVTAILAGAWSYAVRNGLVERAAETALERMFDAPVQLSGVVFNPFKLQAGFRRLRIADAERPERWLIEAGPAAFDVNLTQLLGKKLILREVSLQNVALGTERPEGRGAAPRARPAPQAPVPAPKPAGGTGTPKAPARSDQAVEGHGMLEGLVPSLDLSGLIEPVSVDRLMQGRKLTALDTVAKTRELAQTRVKFWQERMSGTAIPQELRAVERDAQALRFNVKNPNDLKVLQSDLQTLNKRLDIARKDLQELNEGWKQDRKTITAGWAAVSTATEEDIRAIRSAAKLPNLDAAQIGAAIFGSAAMEQFNAALGYARMAQRALRSDGAKSAEAPRRSGRWIHYPVTTRVYPGFALEKAVFSGTLSDAKGQLTTRFEGRMLALSSDAKVYGQPLRISGVGTTQEGRQWTAEAVFDHRAEPGSNTLTVRGNGISLGTVKLSERTDGLYPDAMAIPQSDVELAFALAGEKLEGSLRVVARKVSFRFADNPKAQASEIGKAMRSVFSDLQHVELKATLSGTLARPKFQLASSVDQILSGRLRGLVGKRVAEIDREIRARITAQVGAAQAEAQQAVAAQQAQLEQTLGQMEQRARQVQQTLEQRAKQVEAELKKALEKQARDSLKLPRR
jgi:uncharacterized protein (TIGR03545 family)